MADVAINSILQGLAVGLIWVPLTTATFSTLDKRHFAETAAVYHLIRNLGSSVFISLSVFVVIRTSQISYAELTAFISPFNEIVSQPAYRGTVDFGSTRGLLGVSGEIDRQASMIGFINAFGLYTLASLIILPLVAWVKVPKANPQSD